MTPEQMMQALASKQGQGDGVVTFSPGPFKMQVSDADARASQLLLQITEQWPGLTTGECIETLQAAIWWETFWATQVEAEPARFSLANYNYGLEGRTMPNGKNAVHLWVERENGTDGITWDELQEVKNQVLGTDARAVEFYPPHRLEVNERNRRHLWVFDFDVLPETMFGAP